MPSKVLKVLFALALVTGGVACGDDSESAEDSPAGVDVGTDESSNDAADTVDDPDDSDDSDDADVTGGPDAAGMTSGGAGSLTLVGETIALDSRCFLEAQVSAGMTMESTARGMGTNAHGDAALPNLTPL